MKIEGPVFFLSCPKDSLVAGRYPFFPQDGILVPPVILDNGGKISRSFGRAKHWTCESFNSAFRANNPKEIAAK
jgi:hypothetical protein